MTTTLRALISTLTILFLFTSCDSEKSKKTGKEKFLSFGEFTNGYRNKNSKDDIALLEDYLIKQNQDVRDDDGFKVDYEVKQDWKEVRIIAISDSVVVYDDDGRQQTKFLELYVGKSKYELYRDGELQKTMALIGQIYSEKHLLNGREFLDNKQRHYFPELHDKSVRDEIITQLTSSHTFFGQNITNEVNKNYTTAIKESKIFDYESLEDFEK